jgi:hypothetical protein
LLNSKSEGVYSLFANTNTILGSITPWFIIKHQFLGLTCISVALSFTLRSPMVWRSLSCKSFKSRCNLKCFSSHINSVFGSWNSFWICLHQNSIDKSIICLSRVRIAFVMVLVPYTNLGIEPFKTIESLILLYRLWNRL